MKVIKTNISGNVYSRKEIVIGGCRKMKIEEIDNYNNNTFKV